MASMIGNQEEALFTEWARAQRAAHFARNGMVCER